MRTPIIYIQTMCALILCVLSACSDGPQGEPDGKITVSFESDELNFQEGEGNVQVKVQFSEALQKDANLSFAISGDAVEDRDYRLNSNSLSINQGERQINLSVELIDDALIEGDMKKELTLTLNPTQDLALGAISSLDVIIQDDDTPTLVTDGYAFDLTWHSGDLPAGSVLNQADLDLILSKENNMGQYVAVGGSEEKNSFESFVLDGNAEDGNYKLEAKYFDGTLDVELSLAFTPANSSTPQKIVLNNFAAQKDSRIEILKFKLENGAVSIQ